MSLQPADLDRALINIEALLREISHDLAAIRAKVAPVDPVDPNADTEAA